MIKYVLLIVAATSFQTNETIYTAQKMVPVSKRECNAIHSKLTGVLLETYGSKENYFAMCVPVNSEEVKSNKPSSRKLQYIQ